MIEIEENSKYKKKYYLQYIEFVLFINIIFLLAFGIYNYKKSFSPYDPKIKEEGPSRGPIVVHGGFTSAFYEFNKEGT